MKWRIFFLIFTLILSACGGDDSTHISFETENNPPTEEPPPFSSGDIVSTIPFPQEYTWIGDLVVDGSSAWMLAGTNITLDAFIQIDLETGAVLQVHTNSEFFLNHGSELAFDGENFRGTSYGYMNGVPQNHIFTIDQTGAIIGQMPCPTSNTGGFCEGLAWDGIHLWSGASDNRNLARFDLNGDVYLTIENLWDTIGINQDLAFNPQADHVTATHNSRLLRIDPETGSIITETALHLFKGDRDGDYWWQANNTTREIEKVYIGE